MKPTPGLIKLEIEPLDPNDQKAVEFVARVVAHLKGFYGMFSPPPDFNLSGDTPKAPLWVSTNPADGKNGAYVPQARATAAAEAEYQKALLSALRHDAVTAEQIAALAKAGMALGKSWARIAADLKKDVWLSRPLPMATIEAIRAECGKITKTG